MCTVTGATRDSVLAELTQRITSINAGCPVRIAIDGPDMAGKTVLADELAHRMDDGSGGVVRASIDSFHRPQEERYRRGRESPEGYYLDSFDLDQVRDVLLEPLGPDGTRVFRTAVFDVRANARVRQAPQRAREDAILIVDGIFLLRPELQSYWEFSIFVWASPAERLGRSLVRDLGPTDSAEDLERRYRTRYLPGQQLYQNLVGPDMVATVFVDNEDPYAPRLLSRA